MRTLLVSAVVGCVALLVLSCRLARESSDPLGPNAACYVCHMTFVGEELSKVHLKARIPCIRCHGLSAAHANDEKAGTTRPDVFIKGDQINPFCRRCHRRHNVQPEKLVARWLEHSGSATSSQASSATVTCTSCHGSHRIARQGG